MHIATQLNITIPNSPNTLAMMGDKLRAADVNIVALSCTEGSPNSVIHLIVNDAETAKIVLKDIGPVTMNEVLMFDIKNKPGAIAAIARDFAIVNINIKNVWATTHGTGGELYVHVENAAEAKEKLEHWKRERANHASA